MFDNREAKKKGTPQVKFKNVKGLSNIRNVGLLGILQGKRKL